jgi:hypothetical protein
VSMGGLFTDYFTSDVSASPPDTHSTVSEKTILLPHTLFITSFAFSRCVPFAHRRHSLRFIRVPSSDSALTPWRIQPPSSSKALASPVK